MIPGAGLYLPHSSHVNHEAASTRTEARTMKQKYFERKTALQDKDKNLNTGRTPSRTSLALSRKSTEDVTKVFSSLSTVFDFADYASSHEKVSSNSEVFINLLQRVRQDVTEASRLYKSQAVTDYFDSWPDKKTYVDTILLDIQRALNDIGIYMETVRVFGDDGGSVGLRRKFEWVLSHHKKLISKQQNLTVCHQSLMTAVHVMLTAEMNVAFNGQDPIYEAPTRPWIPEDARDIFRSPHSRQKWRSSQRNLSMPSIVVSEARNDKSLEKSTNTEPVELPGSTPDDLPQPDNLDLYASPPKPRSLSMDAVRLDGPSTQISSQTSVPDAVFKPIPTQTSLDSSTQAPSNSLPARRSFDQVRPPASSTQERSRAPLGQSRPQAYSDQAPIPSSSATRPRASFDQARSLPTLNEKPLERYDSNASVAVTQAATVPLKTMRHKPKAVNVRKAPMKHYSAPSELPSLIGQTSLMDDLSNWVLPNSAQDSYRINDSPTSVISSTPSTSITSSPVSTHSPTSYPGMANGFGNAVVPPLTGSSPTAVSTTPASQSTHKYIAYRPPLRAPPPVPHVAARAGTSNASEPVIPQMIVQNAQLPQNKDNKAIVLSAVRVTQDPIAGEEAALRPMTTTKQGTDSATPEDPASKHRASASIKSAEAAVNNVSKPAAVALPTAQVKEPTSVAIQSTEVISTEQGYPRSAKPTVPAVQSKSAEPVTSPPPAPATSSQPLTAQARRRAAHARRMQAAYGAEQNKGTEGGAVQ